MFQLSQELAVAAGSEVLVGESPRLPVTGPKPKEIATLHAWCQVSIYEPPIYAGTRVLAHAYAEFQADSEGRIEVDYAAPIKGTYDGADPLGLRVAAETRPDDATAAMTCPGLLKGPVDFAVAPGLSQVEMLDSLGGIKCAPTLAAVIKNSCEE